MPSTVAPAPRRNAGHASGSLYAGVIVAAFVLPPLLSLALNASGWIRYGIDLPYADDWRTYRDGTAYSLDIRNLAAPANDTLFPVGRVLDVMAMRYLGGNSVAYQLLSMTAVLGGLLWLQWRLLMLTLQDRVMAAAAFSLTLFMLQPDSYWGLQNLAYHQAIPLVCALLALLVFLTRGPNPYVTAFLLMLIGFVAGLTYISGAFAILALASVFLAFSLFTGPERRGYRLGGGALLLPGLACTATQIVVVIRAQHGEISAKVPWALPYEADFWAYMMGKFGRSLLLPPASEPYSLCITAAAMLAVLAIAGLFARRLWSGGFRSRAEADTALIFLSLAAIVFVYMFLVASGRTNLRPDTMTKFGDIFAFGFLRFHFFWATVLWPWVGAALLSLLRKRADDSTTCASIAAFVTPILFVPAAIALGAFDHAKDYKGKMSHRLETEVACLDASLNKGGPIVCPAMAGSDVDLRPAYDFAASHDASFTRYFGSVASSMDAHRLQDAPAVVEAVPSGEIQRGSSIVQPVLVSSLDRQAFRSDEICLDILLATYARKNEGSASVLLQLNGRSWDFLLPFSEVADNAFHQMCGTARPVPNDPGKPDLIRIEGIDGSPGRSPAAWLTSDTSNGLVSVDGREMERSLVFTITPFDAFAFGRPYGVLLYAVSAVFLGMCFFGTMVSRQPAKEQAGQA